MSSIYLASLLDEVEIRSGRPPILRAEITSDAPRWTAERRALRAVVAEHGCVLIRGLGLHDVAGTSAVFEQLSTRLMAEREAFAPRRTYADGVLLGAVAAEPADVHAS